MPGPGLTLKRQRHGAGAHPGIRAERVHLGHRRVEEDVHAGGLEPATIFVEGARIARQILAGAELQRVDEDAGDDPVARPSSRRDQAEVAGMKGSHGWNEAHANPLPAPGPGGLLELRHRLNDLHRTARTTFSTFIAFGVRLAP